MASGYREHTAVTRGAEFLARPADRRRRGDDDHRALELGYGALRSHMLVVGTTGAGKTTALVRLWAGFWAAATRRYRRGPGGGRCWW